MSENIPKDLSTEAVVLDGLKRLLATYADIESHIAIKKQMMDMITETVLAVALDNFAKFEADGSLRMCKPVKASSANVRLARELVEEGRAHLLMGGFELAVYVDASREPS